MISDGSYHEQEILDEANNTIDNFLVEHNYSVDLKTIEEFAKKNFSLFQPYLDYDDFIGIINGKLQV